MVQEGLLKSDFPRDMWKITEKGVEYFEKDKKALDTIVLDAHGLTEEETKEVYWPVAEIVKNRLDKAKSV